MVFAEADERHPDLIGENRLVDDVAEHRSMGPRLPRVVVRHIAEGIEPEFDLIHPAMISVTSLGLMARATGSARDGSSPIHYRSRSSSAQCPCQASLARTRWSSSALRLLPVLK